jgi:signal transduction histidine kinase
MSVPIRVLVCDDSAEDFELELDALRDGGFEPAGRRVWTPEELEASLAGGGWDVALADWDTKRLPARAALELLRARGEDLPLIVVSGTAGEEVAVDAMRAGARDFFPKTRIQRLASAVEREVREARGRRDRRVAEAALDQLRAEHERIRDRLILDQQRAVATRDEFIGVASHELKTPITSLQLQLDLALARAAEGGDPELRRRLDAAGRQVRRLAALVDGLLDVTALAQGRLRLALEPTDLAEIVRDTVRLQADAIRRSGSDVRVEAPRPVPGRWDRARLQAIVTHLLHNALKFGGGAPIDVGVHASGAAASLVVRDHGIGIAPLDQERIFARFERAVPDEHTAGLGVGLWLVRRIAEAHGGAIAPPRRRASRGVDPARPGGAHADLETSSSRSCASSHCA